MGAGPIGISIDKLKLFELNQIIHEQGLVDPL